MAHLSGHKDPVLSAGGAEVNNQSTMSRSWELYDVSYGTDHKSIDRAKFIAEVMYRIVGTRPTEGMQYAMGGEVDSKVRASQADKVRGRILQRNSAEMELDPLNKTGRPEDVDPYDEDGFWFEGAKPQ